MQGAKVLFGLGRSTPVPLRGYAGFSLIPQVWLHFEAMGMKTQLQREEAWGESVVGIAQLAPGERGALEGGPDLEEQAGFSINASVPAQKAGQSRSDLEEPDERVLERLHAGEQSAMGELWNRYAGLLFSQAVRVLHNPSEAEDVVVEVFSEVWRRSGGYHPERARPAAWLVTLVRRRAIDRFRERRSHERAEERLALENGSCPPCSNGVEEQVRLSELRRILEQALHRLPERQREAVCMVYFDGLTQREISKRTRTPIGTIKTRLELGLRKMRERIRGIRSPSEAGVGTLEPRLCVGGDVLLRGTSRSAQ